MEERVVFDADLCKGCSLCVSVCPKKIIFLSDKLNDKGYRIATVTEQDQCISCASCARICPDGVIRVYKPSK